MNTKDEPMIDISSRQLNPEALKHDQRVQTEQEWLSRNKELAKKGITKIGCFRCFLRNQQDKMVRNPGSFKDYLTKKLFKVSTWRDFNKGIHKNGVCLEFRCEKCGSYNRRGMPVSDTTIFLEDSELECDKKDLLKFKSANQKSATDYVKQLLKTSKDLLAGGKKNDELDGKTIVKTN